MIPESGHAPDRCIVKPLSCTWCWKVRTVLWSTFHVINYLCSYFFFISDIIIYMSDLLLTPALSYTPAFSPNMIGIWLYLPALLNNVIDQRCCPLVMDRGVDINLIVFQVLQKTCLKYNIHLHAQHLHRENNKAVDNLSNLKTSAFREIGPNSSPTSKKTTKLLFCLPLIREKEEKHYGEPDKLS